MKPRQSKFHNVPVVVDGVRFASKAEAKRAGQLRLLVKAGEIEALELQPRFPLNVNGALVCTYVGDFAYQDGDKRVVEDVKGVETPEFKIKRKLLKALHGIDVQLVRA